MTKRSAEALALPEEQPADGDDRAEKTAGVDFEFPPKDVAAARERMNQLQSDLQEALGWGTGTETTDKIKREIRELQQFVRKHGKPELRIVREAPPPEPERKKKAVYEAKPRKLTIKEIDATIGELEGQRATLVGRMAGAGLKKGETKIVAEQIAAVNGEIAALQEQRTEIINRTKRDFGMKEPIAKVTERMGRSFELAREKKQVEEERSEEASEQVDRDRQRTLAKLEVKQSGLAAGEAEAEFFTASDAEAAERAEGVELMGEELGAEEAIREWRSVVKKSSLSEAEARQRTLKFIDHLHREFPSAVTFTGLDYVTTQSKPQKIGFWKKFFGAKTELQQMDNVIENLPNIGNLYTSFEASRRKRESSTKFRGTRGR